MAKLEALKLGKTAGKRFKFTRKTSSGEAVPVEVLIPLCSRRITSFWHGPTPVSQSTSYMNQTRRLVNDGGMLKSSLIISGDAGLLK